MMLVHAKRMTTTAISKKSKLSDRLSSFHPHPVSPLVRTTRLSLTSQKHSRSNHLPSIRLGSRIRLSTAMFGYFGRAGGSRRVRCGGGRRREGD
jgi:hypothetical protein